MKEITKLRTEKRAEMANNLKKKNNKKKEHVKQGV